jgi:multidrug efflux pump subunit AcrB
MRGATMSIVLGFMTGACRPELLSRFGDEEATRVLVSFRSPDAARVSSSLAAVERAIAARPSVMRIRSVGCSDGGAVVVHVALPNDARSHSRAARVEAAAAFREALDDVVPGATVSATPLHDDLAALAVHPLDDDIFATRAWIESVLRPRLMAVDGVSDVAVVGGRTELQLRIDPERLLAADISIAEVLTAIKIASDLRKAELKRLPGDVTIFLRDVAVIEQAPVGEPLRRDGGISVRVRGAREATDAVAHAIAALPPPSTIRLAVLDGDSTETVNVLVVRKGGASDVADDAAVAVAERAVDAAFADVAAAALSVPGVHSFRRGRRLQLTLDRERFAARGFSTTEAAAAADIAAVTTSGLVVLSARGPLRVVLAAPSTPEALMQTRVLTTASGQVLRLFDIARAALTEEQRREQLDGRVARRLRLSLDAGARTRALAELDARLEAIGAARPGVLIVVEKDGDTAPLDGVCP